MAKKRIKIMIEDNISDVDALQCVMRVVNMGKVACEGKFYSTSNLLSHPNYPKGIIVYTSTSTGWDNSAFQVMLGN